MKNAIIAILILVIIGGTIFFVVEMKKDKDVKVENITTTEPVQESKPNETYGIITELEEGKTLKLDVGNKVVTVDIERATITPANEKLVEDETVKIIYNEELTDGTDVLEVKIVKEHTEESAKETHKEDSEHYLTGIVEEIAMSTIKIKAINYDGHSYLFNKEDAIVESDSKGIQEGDKVRIVHKGKVDGTDTPYVATHIKKITTVTDSKKPEKTTTKAPETHTATGEIIYAAGSIIKIKTEDGKEYEFQTVGAKKELNDKGIVEGEKVTITSNAELSTENTNKATSVIYVKD